MDQVAKSAIAVETLSWIKENAGKNYKAVDQGLSKYITTHNKQKNDFYFEVGKVILRKDPAAKEISKLFIDYNSQIDSGNKQSISDAKDKIATTVQNLLSKMSTSDYKEAIIDGINEYAVDDNNAIDLLVEIANVVVVKNDEKTQRIQTLFERHKPELIEPNAEPIIDKKALNKELTSKLGKTPILDKLKDYKRDSLKSKVLNNEDAKSIASAIASRMDTIESKQGFFGYQNKHYLDNAKDFLKSFSLANQFLIVSAMNAPGSNIDEETISKCETFVTDNLKSSEFDSRDYKLFQEVLHADWLDETQKISARYFTEPQSLKYEPTVDLEEASAPQMETQELPAENELEVSTVRPNDEPFVSKKKFDKELTSLYEETPVLDQLKDYKYSSEDPKILNLDDAKNIASAIASRMDTIESKDGFFGYFDKKIMNNTESFLKSFSLANQFLIISAMHDLKTDESTISTCEASMMESLKLTEENSQDYKQFQAVLNADWLDNTQKIAAKYIKGKM